MGVNDRQSLGTMTVDLSSTEVHHFEIEAQPCFVQRTLPTFAFLGSVVIVDLKVDAVQHWRFRRESDIAGYQAICVLGRNS